MTAATGAAGWLIGPAARDLTQWAHYEIPTGNLQERHPHEVR